MYSRGKLLVIYLFVGKEGKKKEGNFRFPRVVIIFGIICSSFCILSLSKVRCGKRSLR